jgi:hypothetical protein
VSSSETNPAPFGGLDLSALRRGVAIYLDRAYRNSNVPEAVKRRLAWPEEAPAGEVLSHAPFERVQSPEQGESAIYALRLGNARYPHMKLQVQSWPNAEGYLLSVNTHDQVLAQNPNMRDLEAFRALQAENLKMKEEIEQAWDEAGLPTFLRYLRNYLSQQSPGADG